MAGSSVRIKFGSATVKTIRSFSPGDEFFHYVLIIRTGASAQDSVGRDFVSGVDLPPLISTQTEDTTAAIIIKVTGENGAAMAGEIQVEGFMVEILN